MSIELDMALRWFAGGAFVGMVTLAWLQIMLRRWARGER